MTTDNILDEKIAVIRHVEHFSNCVILFETCRHFNWAITLYLVCERLAAYGSHFTARALHSLYAVINQTLA